MTTISKAERDEEMSDMVLGMEELVDGRDWRMIILAALQVIYRQINARPENERAAYAIKAIATFTGLVEGTALSKTNIN